jgi:hypothetical protein
MLRAFLSFALVAPPAIAGVLVALALRAPFAAGVVAGTTVALAEAALLVIFAAWRLAGRVDRLSTA